MTSLAITLIRHRLQETYGDTIKGTYKVIGEPESLHDAQKLATDDKYQFQWWALGLVGARPTEEKKGADKGIDGRLYFKTGTGSSAAQKQIIFSVKGGHVSSPHVRDLVGVVDREKAAIGVLISMEPFTKDMKAEAASAGFWKSPEIGDKKYARIQLLTVEDLLVGKSVDAPAFAHAAGNVTLKKAPKAVKSKKKAAGGKLSKLSEYDD